MTDSVQDKLRTLLYQMVVLAHNRSAEELPAIVDEFLPQIATPTPQPQDIVCPTCDGLNGHQPTDNDRYGAIEPKHRTVPDLSAQPAVEDELDHLLGCACLPPHYHSYTPERQKQALQDWYYKGTERHYMRGYKDGWDSAGGEAMEETHRQELELATERAEVEGRIDELNKVNSHLIDLKVSVPAIQKAPLPIGQYVLERLHTLSKAKES